MDLPPAGRTFSEASHSSICRRTAIPVGEVAALQDIRFASFESRFNLTWIILPIEGQPVHDAADALDLQLLDHTAV